MVGKINRLLFFIERVIMTKDFSISTIAVFQIAQWESGTTQQVFIEKEHLFLGICGLEEILKLEYPETKTRIDWGPVKQEYRPISKIFQSLSLNPAQMRIRLREAIKCNPSKKNTEKATFRSAECFRVLNRAEELSGESPEISCICMLAAVLNEPSRTIDNLLGSLGVSTQILKDKVARVLIHGEILDEGSSRLDATNSQKDKAPVLLHYGRDLSMAALEGKLGPFSGRQKEMLQVVQTLARCIKNNPVLVGDAGVGKTAIVEALAVCSTKNQIKSISGKRIIELNIGSLLGGTKFRGEFEERLVRILEEVKLNPRIILFIDELHNVVGAGQAEGSLDAANILKPALARGEIRCIGATTIAEYHKYIESDSALERRFEKILVEEPSIEDTLNILKILRPKFEQHHGVKITDDSLKAAINLTLRFDIEHNLPDKAIDLVDKAGAVIQIVNQQQQEEGSESPQNEVTDQLIATVLSEKTAIPVEILSGYLSDRTDRRSLQLEPFLKAHLYGQNTAIEKVCERLNIAYSGIIHRKGPLGVFLFLGPTGVGKTELARLLAKFIFGSESDLIRLDMSEYMEEHSCAKLIGSPPGYVGYKEDGQLTGKLRTKPYSVVLFDEIDKAHPRVLDMFLQIFDAGRITDAKGITANAQNCIFIMTANAKLKRNNITGFKIAGTDQSILSDRQDISNNPKTWLQPEFINRIDEQLIFNHLSENALRQILDIQLKEIFTNIKEKYRTTISIDSRARNLLVANGYSYEYGARELHRTIERYVQVPLSNLVLTKEITKYPNWNLTADTEKIIVLPEEPSVLSTLNCRLGPERHSDSDGEKSLALSTLDFYC
jgi:ATP-dependent Clp protease ATP-binding subunit ClpC